MKFDFETIINRKGTWCTQWDYVQDRFGVADLLPFTISDMDFATAPAVMTALEKRLEHPVLGYSRWQHNDFKDAIVAWFAEQFNTTILPEHIVYGPSVIFMVSEMIRLWSDVGDGIVLHSPAYDAFDKVVLANQRVLVKTELIKHSGLTESGAQYECDFVDLENKLKHPKNKVLLLCNPHNPTGKVWTKSELDHIAQLCQRYNVCVISDEIHMDMVWNPTLHSHHSPWSNHGLSSWCIFTSASKSFNVPALTGAYGIVSDTAIHDVYLHQLKAVYGLSSPAILGVIAHIAAYRAGNEWLLALKDYIYDNFMYLQQRLNAQFPELNWQLPQASYLAWIDLMPFFEQFDTSVAILVQKLQNLLIHHEKVAIMPGSTYGTAYEHFIRLNLACSRLKLEKGINGLCNALMLLKSG